MYKKYTQKSHKEGSFTRIKIIQIFYYLEAGTFNRLKPPDLALLNPEEVDDADC